MNRSTSKIIIRKFTLIKCIAILIFSLINKDLFSQITYYQDIYNGGVTIIGSSSADAQGIVNLPINTIPIGSTIRKIFFISYSLTNSEFEKSPFNFSINSQPFLLNSNDFVNFTGSNFVSSSGNPYTGHNTYIKDLTQFLSITNNQIEIDWNNFQNTTNNCLGCRYSAPEIIICYENPNLDIINYSLIINNNSNNLSINNLIQFENPIKSNTDIAFGIHSDRLGQNLVDGYEFFINGNSIGICNTMESSSINSGCTGTFYYDSGICNGLTDDTPDAFFNGSDALILLNNLLINNSSFQFDFNYLENSNFPNNFIINYNLAYTSNCQTQNVQTPKDTTLCLGETLQLAASGGVQYE